METQTPDRDFRLEARRLNPDRRTEDDRRVTHLSGKALYEYIRLLYDRRELERRLFSRRQMVDRRTVNA